MLFVAVVAGVLRLRLGAVPIGPKVVESPAGFGKTPRVFHTHFKGLEFVWQQSTWGLSPICSGTVDEDGCHRAFRKLASVSECRVGQRLDEYIVHQVLVGVCGFIGGGHIEARAEKDPGINIGRSLQLTAWTILRGAACRFRFWAVIVGVGYAIGGGATAQADGEREDDPGRVGIHDCTD